MIYYQRKDETDVTESISVPNIDFYAVIIDTYKELGYDALIDFCRQAVLRTYFRSTMRYLILYI